MAVAKITSFYPNFLLFIVNTRSNDEHNSIHKQNTKRQKTAHWHRCNGTPKKVVVVNVVAVVVAVDVVVLIKTATSINQ